MKHKWLHILLFALLGVSCKQDAELPPLHLQPCLAMPEPVAAGTWFVYNNAIYQFGGRLQDGTYNHNIWQFKPNTGRWRLAGILPMKARVSASACVIDHCVYYGLGFAGHVQRDSSYLRDFWAYYPLTNEWKRLADFPANTTVKNIFFPTDSAIYAVYGFNRQFTQDVYRYDIQANKWEKLAVKAPMTVPRAMDVVGATCQGRHFVGTGFNHGSLRFWAEWVPDKQQFIAQQPILGAGRNAAACCATEDHIYIAGGRHYGDTLTTGFFYSSVQRYSPELNKWEYVGSLPYEAENMVMLSYKGQIYVGLGENKYGVIQDDWYKIDE